VVEIVTSSLSPQMNRGYNIKFIMTVTAVPSPLLRLEGVAGGYGARDVLAGVDGHVAAGEVLRVDGANGTGKTTLLSLMAGVLRPRSGRVLLDGAPLAVSRRAHRRALGSNLPGVPRCALTVREILMSHLHVHGRGMTTDGNEPLDTVEVTMGRLGLDAVGDTPTTALSAGARQRLGVALALVHAPRLVVLDEPLASVDDDGVMRVVDAVQRSASSGAAVVVSSHPADGAFPADRVLRLDGTAPEGAGEVVSAVKFSLLVHLRLIEPGWSHVVGRLDGVTACRPAAHRPALHVDVTGATVGDAERVVAGVVTVLVGAGAEVVGLVRSKGAGA
jgi:ABC-type Mn2+/Zn2+ transport system ATPase subunit